MSGAGLISGLVYDSETYIDLVLGIECHFILRER